jgi:hypothetical protein
MDGSVHAMDHIMILQEELERGLLQKTWKYQNMNLLIAIQL